LGPIRKLNTEASTFRDGAEPKPSGGKRGWVLRRLLDKLREDEGEISNSVEDQSRKRQQRHIPCAERYNRRQVERQVFFLKRGGEVRRGLKKAEGGG